MRKESRKFFQKLSPKKIAKICSNREYTNWQNPYSKQLLRDLLKDDRKPGLIIDGQHRIAGTKSIGQIPFAVSLLPAAGRAELAFQFIVNNSSSRKVSEGLLISIVGNSLTDKELLGTEARLNRSGIKVSLIKAVMRVHQSQNAFVGMLQFGIPGEKGFLEAPAMQKKVVKQWFGTRGKTGTRPKFPDLQLLDRPKWSFDDYFGEICKGTTRAERAEKWQEDLWFEYFRAFWEPISHHFTPRLWPDSKASWPVNPKHDNSHKIRVRLMRVTVLGLLQQALLQVWKEDVDSLIEKEMSTLKKELKVATFKKRIENNIKKIDSDFFTLLKFTGFDASKPVRDDLISQFLKLMQKHATFADLRENHAFWNQS